MKVRLDLNNPDFQKEWFLLQKDEFTASKNTLKKIFEMGWNQIYHDSGLKWEKIQSIKTDKGRELYTIRLSKKHRAVVYRQEAFMIFVSLHPDHDSAYKMT
jgi:hypothetical protein